jgi:hypothetical protein
VIASSSSALKVGDAVQAALEVVNRNHSSFAVRQLYSFSLSKSKSFLHFDGIPPQIVKTIKLAGEEGSAPQGCRCQMYMVSDSRGLGGKKTHHLENDIITSVLMNDTINRCTATLRDSREDLVSYIGTFWPVMKTRWPTNMYFKFDNRINLITYTPLLCSSVGTGVYV